MIRYLDSLLVLGLLAGAGVNAQAAAPPPPPPSQIPAQPQAPAAPENPPAIDFHSALAPHGTWMTLAPYGEVWVPHDVPSDWRPYSTGHWVYADTAGWTWVDDEPWGWAPFHYGRWTLDPTLGWAWIPGDVWAPAWVAWRECDGFVGWAPLPPCATWHAGVGLFFGGVDLAVAIGDPWWCFVPVAHLCHPHVHEVLLVRERVHDVLRNSHIVERGVVLENGHPVNRAIAVERIEKVSAHPVQHVVLRDVDGPEKVHGAPVGPREMAVFRPQPHPRVAARAPEPQHVQVNPPSMAPERRVPQHPLRGTHIRRWHETKPIRADLAAGERPSWRA